MVTEMTPVTEIALVYRKQVMSLNHKRFVDYAIEDLLAGSVPFVRPMMLPKSLVVVERMRQREGSSVGSSTKDTLQLQRGQVLKVSMPLYGHHATRSRQGEHKSKQYSPSIQCSRDTAVFCSSPQTESAAPGSRACSGL